MPSYFPVVFSFVWRLRRGRKMRVEWVEGEVLEQKSFTAGLRSIDEHQDFAVRLLRSRLRNLFAGPANKGRKSKNINVKAFFFPSRWSHWAPLLTNSYFSSATLRLFSFQKRRNIRIIESNIHRPFTALRFFSICAERLFKKNELYSFRFPSAAFSFCLYLSHVFHGAVAVRHDKLNQGYRTKHLGAPIYSATSEEQLTHEG